jgi:hypothetical protein
VLGLPWRRDAQVEGSAQWHGHGKCLLKSSARPEQFIEEIAESCLEHVEFGVGDRHAVGPIVGDGPSLDIMLDGPSEARPRARNDVKIIGHNAEADALSGHPASITPLGSQTNGLSLSGNALLPPGKSVMKGATSLTSNLDRLRAICRGRRQAVKAASREAVAR